MSRPENPTFFTSCSFVGSVGTDGSSGPYPVHTSVPFTHDVLVLLWYVYGESRLFRFELRTSRETYVGRTGTPGVQYSSTSLEGRGLPRLALHRDPPLRPDWNRPRVRDGTASPRWWLHPRLRSSRPTLPRREVTEPDPE